MALFNSKNGKSKHIWRALNSTSKERKVRSGQLESHNSVSKYNLNLLNTLAIDLGVSPKDFLPEKPFKDLKRKKG